MNFGTLIDKLLDGNVFIPTLIAVAVVFGMTVQAIRSVFQTIARERSRREIAAYIAEGSMSADQGERLMRAGDRPDQA